MRIGRRLMSTRSQSSGQTLPLFAILAPGMLALMALGLDGAQLFLERRDAQGAADLAALAGGASLPGDAAQARADAVSIGVANGYQAADVVAVTPYDGDATRIEVTIDSHVDTFFLSILNVIVPGDYSTIGVSARAVAHGDPGGEYEGNYALFSLQTCGSKEDFKAIDWSGNENTIEGSVHSNSGVTLSGNDNEIVPQPGGTESEFSVTCVGTSGSPSSLRITDKYPYNEGGDNPALTDGEMVPPDCTGTEDPGEVCRKVVPIPDIPFYDETTGAVDTASMAAKCTTTWSGDRDVTPSMASTPGVYCALNGKMVIKAGTYADVTFFAREFDVGDDGVKLTSPHLDDILMYATTSTEGKGIVYSGNNGQFGSPSSPGFLYSPRASSMVSFAGEGNEVYGALVGYYIKFNGNKSLLVGSFGSQDAGPGSVALIE